MRNPYICWHFELKCSQKTEQREKRDVMRSEALAAVTKQQFKPSVY